MILSWEPVLFQHPGRVGQDGLDLFLGDAELAGYLLDGGAAARFSKTACRGSRVLPKVQAPASRLGSRATPGQSPQLSLFPAVFSSVDMCVTSRRVVVPF